MSFMVIFRTGDGKPGYHQVDDLDGSLRFVEHLRNSEGVDNARVYRLEEIPIEVRTYYRVEVAKAGAAPPRPADGETVDAPADAPADADDGDPVGAGRRGLFR